MRSLERVGARSPRLYRKRIYGKALEISNPPHRTARKLKNTGKHLKSPIHLTEPQGNLKNDRLDLFSEQLKLM